ncbi:ABC transporter permease [Neorhizobium sp. JUb45]|uniref:ABC transporter permease n=1 Tax=Neorhizobium sp. JUb45 TaxID=2485113 RepID=UPI00104E705B|nr:ABC transporter permease [Neorhizobium sp. JUb45]TCQ99437.1 putative spermidine/putrescine transport system permease protein [Neorhizobium sp. JUb45]
MHLLRHDLAIAAPGILLLLVAFVMPVSGILLLGVQDADRNFTLMHLTRFLTDPFYVAIGWRTVKLSLVITAICFAAGFPLAYIMARGGPKLRLWLLIAITLPLMTSVVVRTFGWMVILGRGGLVPQLMNALGLANRNFTLMQTETAIVIGMIQVLFPFMVLSILGVISKVDLRLEEAARVMGCSYLQSMRLVVLPLAMPGVIAGSLLVFTLSASYFITPTLLGGARLPVLASAIYETATKTLDWHFAAAQSIVLLAGVLLLMIPYARLSRKANG